MGIALSAAPSRGRNAGITVAALALVVAAPYLTGSAYLVGIATIGFAFVVLSVCFNVVYGYMGYLSLGQVAFWAIGGYCAAILATRWHLSPWLGFLAGGVLAAVIAFVVGLPSLRLSRHSFAIVTLTLGLLTQLVATDWVSMTRGPLGIPQLPAPRLDLGFVSVSFGQPLQDYYLMLAVAVLVVAVLYRFTRSRCGQALRAIKADEALAEAQGLDTLRYKLLAFTTAAFFSGLVGAVFVFHLALVDPSIADFYYTEAVLIIVIVAGAGSYWPVVVSALVFTFLPEVLRASEDQRLIIYGVVLVLATLLLPQGLAGLARRGRRPRGSREDRDPGPSSPGGGDGHSRREVSEGGEPHGPAIAQS